MSQDAKISAEEGNAKIAKFMGCEFGHGFWAGTGNYFFPNDKATADELKYHSSWDWLMPIVQKILKTDTGSLDCYVLSVCDSLATADIKQVYEAVIRFIESYKQKEI